MYTVTSYATCQMIYPAPSRLSYKFYQSGVGVADAGKIGTSYEAVAQGQLCHSGDYLCPPLGSQVQWGMTMLQVRCGLQIMFESSGIIVNNQLQARVPIVIDCDKSRFLCILIYEMQLCVACSFQNALIKRFTH